MEAETKGFFQTIREIMPDFFILDSLTALSTILVADQRTYRVYLEELFKLLNENKITSILICEEIKDIASYKASIEEFLADGIIVMYNISRGGIRTRAIEVLKFRGLKHERKIVSMEITDDGIIIYPQQQILEI